MVQINPYQYTLPTPSPMFVGRWDLVDELITSLSGPQLHSWGVIGGRRFGKSSVLKAIETRLMACLADRAPGDWCVFPVVIDLQRSETESVQQIYAYILMQLYDALCKHTEMTSNLAGTQLHTLAFKEIEKLKFNDFVKTLDDLVKRFAASIGPTRFVLLLDEVEYAINFSWHTTLFSQLRSLVYSSELLGVVKLVLTGSARVVQVREAGSPLLNALELHYLAPLLADAIDQLIAHGGLMPQAAAHTIFEQCGGHPFIAQYLLHGLWDPTDLFTQTTSAQVIQVAQQMRLNRPDFQGWWEAIGESGRVAYAFLARRQDEVEERTLLASLHYHALSLDQALRNLSYHGLIVRNAEGNRYRTAGVLFRDWYLRNATHTESASEFTAKHEALQPLRELLIEIYDKVEDARRVAEDSGLHTANIDLNTTLINCWHNILAEAHKQSKIKAIVDTAKREYSPKSERLAQGYQVYLKGVYSS